MSYYNNPSQSQQGVNMNNTQGSSSNLGGMSQLGGASSNMFGGLGQPQQTGYNSQSTLGSSQNMMGYGNSSQLANSTGFGGSASNMHNTGFGNTGSTNLGSGFGSNTNTAGFGNTGNTTGFGNTGNLNSTGFGNNNMNTTGFGNANTTSFGNTNTTGFGNTGVTPGLGSSPLSASSGGLGGFGATSTGFGATSTNTGFGSSTNTFGAASSGLGNAFGNTTGFGGGTSSTAFGNAFGNTTGIGLSGANQSANASSNSIINSSLRNTTGSIDDVHCTIDYLEKAYDKNSPMYKFSYTFYNLIDPSSPAPQKPSNVSNELWAQANSLNPYPGYLYPEIIFGHDELSLRLEKQKSVIDKLKISRKYLGDRLNELKEGGILKLTNKLASINEKYNSLLVEVLEQAGKSLGPEIKSVSSQYNQLEKRSNLLGDGLTSLSENVLAYKREFIPSAQDKTQAILEEQSSILENMLISVKKKLSE